MFSVLIKMTIGDASILMNDVTALKRILIVDDEPTILLTLSYALQTKNVEVITSSCLGQAEDAARSIIIKSLSIFGN
jgi:DNA-binding NtrC family response regulator